MKFLDKSIIERFSGIFLIAGGFLFLGAILSLGIVPALMVDKVNPRLGLPDTVPPEFKQYYASSKIYGDALLHGRDLYIREACWLCHSQYVRPVSGESIMYGPVSTPGEYNTVLQMPQLLGTRRVGPDLIRESGKKSNDWHFAHLYQPTNVVPESVMPGYPWYFKKNAEGIPEPTEDAVAIVAYLQSLGRDFADRIDNERDLDQVVLPPEQ